jgi:beta-glucosidase
MGLGSASFLLAALCLTSCASAQRPPAAAPAPVDTAQMNRFVDSVLAGLTLEEKLGQLTQYRGEGTPTGPQVAAGGEDQIRSGAVGSFLGVHGAAYTRRMQRLAVEESRARIPLLFAHDVIHGFRTMFPVPLAEASSWDPEEVERAARVAAVEATAHGLHWTFAPMVDIARDARWGRIVEGAGEDPYLGSVMAAARVRGFQGTDLRADNTLLATAKHFVAYGGAEAGRDYNTVDISPRTLWEIYLPPFHASVDAGVATAMGAFNEVAGIPMHAHEELIDGVLRGVWDWNGLVVSDYTGVMELIPHGVAADSADAAALALQAGVDVDMVSGIYLHALPSLVRSNRVRQADIDEAVRRVLRAKYEVGLFEDPYRYSDSTREQALTLTAEHRAASREMARKSIVLLKNDGRALPISKTLGTLAVIGPMADDARSAIGNWAAAGRAEDAITVLEGIRRAVSANTRVVHAKGVEVQGDDTSGVGEAVALARQADAVVLVIGEREDMSAEAANRAMVDLPGRQLDLVKAVRATGKPVVAVLMNGRPLALQWLADSIPAILETWFLGVEMGPAVADVLFGDVSPSGKLPVSFPRVTGQLPLYYNHKNTGRPPSEQERFTSKYSDVSWTPLYPFGHGLSYTTFAYRNLRLGADRIALGDSITVSVEVSNTGDRAGDEVVQLYVRDEVGSVTRPVKELRGFERVSLTPGQSETVTFTLGPAELAFFGQDMQRIVEPGFFTVFVGTSSEQVESARFEITGSADCAALVLSPRVLGWLPDRLAVRSQDVAGTCRAREAQ